MSRNLKRIFVIEPGLIKASGHPIQYVLALQQFGRSAGLRVIIASHKNADKEVLGRIDAPLPIISRSCFEFARDGPTVLYKDLRQLDEKCGLGEDDLVIAASCYTKEIEGIAMFEREIPRSRCPAIVLNFHQLFPPAPISSLVCRPEYRAFWIGQLRKAFVSIRAPKSRISLWTTVSESLNQAYQTVAGRQCGMLPFPLWKHDPNGIEPVHHVLPRCEVKFAFLGDGRQEKGLLIFLKTIERHFRPDSSTCFVIQNIDARGQDAMEAEELKSFLSKVQRRSDTVVIHESLLVEDFHDLICATDAVVLPYHPSHYEQRASILFVQAAVNQKPVIASEGTWMAAEIKKKHASGVIFDYEPSSPETRMNNLKMALFEMRDNIKQYRLKAEQLAGYYATVHTAEQYLITLMNHPRVKTKMPQGDNN